MRFSRIRFILPVLLLPVLAACSAAPTPLPETLPPPVTSTATVPATSTAAQAYPPADSAPTVQAETGEVYPVPQSPAPEGTAGYPGPQESAVPAGPVPTGFPDASAITWQTVASGFDRPIALAAAGAGRLLVMDQHGHIFVVENGAQRGELFLDITDRVGINGNEQGLLGLALDPGYTENGFFYVNYTDGNGDTVISRFTADPNTAVARPDSEKVLLRQDQPYKNHNGGGLAFGPDGYLYIGLGDGGQAGDPEGRAQNVNTLLGKILRIDVNGGDPYAIPANNPFAAGGGSKEIWAYGLRNPWRFSFDSLTGDLYIGDVGQNKWEEIDFLPAGTAGGVNFGWDFREGANAYEGDPPSGLTLVEPIFQYPHPEGCSVTGGQVYRGQNLPEFYGIYLFSDFCTGKIWGLYRDADGQWQHQMLFESGLSPSSFGVDEDNELYLLDHKNGAVMKLVRK